MMNISKSFSGNQVLKDVEFNVKPGEIHALMGENGAGKSTLVKVLTGIHPRDTGVIKVEGQEVIFTNPKQAENEGLVVIHQELNIIPDLDRKSTRLNSSHVAISYAVFCLKKKTR